MLLCNLTKIKCYTNFISVEGLKITYHFNKVIKSCSDKDISKFIKPIETN